LTKISKEPKGLTLPLSNCFKCSLYRPVSYNPHNYWGTLKNPDVLFIGEAPGKTEKETGKAFQGRAGRLLQDSLRKVGIESFAIANVVACRPEAIDPKYGKIKDRKPTATEIRHCGENLDAIIAQVNPRYIAALGATAMNRMKITGGITVNRGIMVETEYGQVIPIFHPAYILRAPNFITEFEADLKTLKGFISGNQDIKKPQGDYIVIEDSTEVEELEKILSSRKAFSFDIETDGLTFFKDKIMGIGFCNKVGIAYYVPLLKSVSKEPVWGDHQSSVIESLKRIMTNPAKKIAHNGKFDIKFIQHHWNIEVNNFWVDTMLLHYVLDENKPHGLKELAGFYFPEMRNYNQALRTALTVKDFGDESFGNVPLEILGPYCAMDCESTYRLAKVLLPELTPPLKKLFMSFYMPLSKVYTEAEILGVKIDVPYIKTIADENDERILELEKTIFEIAEEEFNINSTQQLSHVLFDKLNYPILNKTLSGKPSTAEGALKELTKKLRKKSPILTCVMEYRRLKKMNSTYLRPMVEKVDGNSRIHPSFLLHGTVTGRISSKGPNIQNIPRDPRIKGMFIPEKDYLFVETDFSQAELRVMAYYSGDKVMTQQYMNGEDIHLATAAFIFMKDPSEITKEERKTAKLVNFGYLYGATPQKAHSSINERVDADQEVISLREAKLFRDKFFQNYAGIEKFIRITRMGILRRGYIKSCFGRIRTLPQTESPYDEKRSEAQRQGLNALIQGTASDLTQLALIAMHKFLKPYKSRFMFTVHDAIVFEVHKSEKHLLPKLKKIMEGKYKPFEFPMVADIEIFEHRWGND
jgi:DNA polymerase-1